MQIRTIFVGMACAAAVSISSAQIAQQLQNGDDFVFKFNGADYIISGAANFSESFNPRPPIRLEFADLNNDGVALDILLDLQPIAGVDRAIPLYATVVTDGTSEAIIRWSGTDNPDLCVEVSDDGFTASIKIFEVSGKLTGRVRRVECASDPYSTLNRNIHLEIVKEGGDAENNLNVKAYLFCVENEFTVVNVDVYNLRWTAAGGGLSKRVGNVNGDCVVDDADLLQVLFNFGSDNADTDTNGDGIVDDADLLVVLFNFGVSV